jgi:hypothetical protein
MMSSANLINRDTQDAQAQATQASIAEAIQKAQAKKESFSHLYIMFYRHGMNANLTKGFYFPGTLLEARARAEAHCSVMGYKFIFVRPMVCNLEEEEKYRMRGMAEGDIPRDY